MAAEEPGEIRIDFADKQMENGKTVFKMHTTSGLSMNTKTPVGVNFTPLPVADYSDFKCKGYVVVYFKSDAADTIESEESALRFELEVYDRATGRKERNEVLTLEKMTDFKPSGTADTVLAAAVWAYVCYWEVPDGKFVKVAAGKKVHVYLGDDT